MYASVSWLDKPQPLLSMSLRWCPFKSVVRVSLYILMSRLVFWLDKPVSASHNRFRGYKSPHAPTIFSVCLPVDRVCIGRPVLLRQSRSNLFRLNRHWLCHCYQPTKRVNMPKEWWNGDVKMIRYCLFCGGSHRWDINACPAPPEQKKVQCNFCHMVHAWNIEVCPEKDNIDRILNCLYCGTDHERDKDKCPALNNDCELCGETGHFSSECDRLAAANAKREEQSKAQQSTLDDHQTNEWRKREILRTTSSSH